MTIKVSIIIPVYNAQKYLRRCLDSLINQTLKEIEIICINDGSTDNSLNILKEYEQNDSRIIIINQENSGIGKARNSGIKIAKGEYIGFVDADDWVDKDYYEKLYNAAKKYDSDIAAGDFYREGKIFKTKKLKHTAEEFITDKEKIFKKAVIPRYNYVWNKIYRSSEVKKYLFDNVRYYEDILWLCKVLFYLKGYVTVADTFYHYIRNPKSVVTQRTSAHKADYIKSGNEMMKFLKENNIPIPPHKLGKKDKIKVFGILFLKKEYYYPSKIKYKLFGFIPFIEINLYDPDAF